MDLLVLVAFAFGVVVGVVLNEWLLPFLVDLSFRFARAHHHPPHGR